MVSLTALLLRPATTLRPQTHLSPLSSTSRAKPEEEKTTHPTTTTTTTSILELAAIVGGLVSNQVIGVSLSTLKTTGCGLPPGPAFHRIGAAEGVSYLVVAGIEAWSVYAKVKTGFGLPNGPCGLFGAGEGLSYLTVLAIAIILGLQFVERVVYPARFLLTKCFR